MKCPHCQIVVHASIDYKYLGKDIDGSWAIGEYICPACGKYVFYLTDSQIIYNSSGGFVRVIEGKYEVLIYPNTSGRSPCPKEVPISIAEDYNEACLVLNYSFKASAALSRRCLQSILRDAANVSHADLSKEIKQVIGSNSLPSYISEDLDNVRIIGNFAAHPTKYLSTGEIVPVELKEAEWNLNVIEALFDFYYVQPDRAKKRREEFKEKLNDTTKAKKV